MSNHAQTLALCPIFEGLSTENLRQLDLQCRWRRYGAGCEIRDLELSGVDLCFIVVGEIRVRVQWSKRKTIVVQDIGRGSFVGGLTGADTSFVGKQKFTALVNTTVALVPWRSFQTIVSRHPEFLQSFLAALRQENARLVGKLAELSFLRVRERIFAELIRMSKHAFEDGEIGVISPPPLHTDIAGRVSTHREAVSRAINELERAGLLERRRGAMVIRNVPKLKEMIRSNT